MVCFFLLGVAVTMAVPKTDAALPVAYGTMLPLAFISDVFFPSVHAPHWLYDLASAFPVAPVARAMEASFNPATHAWPMPATGLLGSPRLEHRRSCRHRAGIPLGTRPDPVACTPVTRPGAAAGRYLPGPGTAPAPRGDSSSPWALPEVACQSAARPPRRLLRCRAVAA